MRRMVVSALALALAGTAGPAGARDCDLACATAAARDALAALQAGAPGKALKGARITENGREIRLADSQLHAIRSLISTTVVAEPVAGAAGVFGAAEAFGGPAIFAVRLKLKGGSVSEAETIVVRRGEAAAFAPQGLAEAPPPSPQAPVGRTSRDGLLALSGAYLDGLETGAPAASGCTAFENGVRLAGCGALTAAPGARVRDRRVALVDEAGGLVWILGVADVPPSGPRRAPRSLLLSALLGIAGDRVQSVALVVRDAPAGAVAGWALPKPKKK